MSQLEKWVTLKKLSHIWLLVTLEKMCHRWQNGSHLKKRVTVGNRLLHRPMTSNGSTLTKCPPKNTGLFVSDIQRFPDRTIQEGQIIKGILVRAKLSNRLLHVDRNIISHSNFRIALQNNFNSETCALIEHFKISWAF